jgi:serine/threonine-protein kinase
LNINSIPASNVILDGRPMGTTPKIGVSVSSGRHTVVFVLEGKRASKSVTVAAGASQTVAHRFN